MKAHTEIPGLEGLEKDVHEHCRLEAGRARIRESEHKLTDKIAAQLQAAGVSAATVTLHLGTFLVNLRTSQAGKVYASVTKIGEPA